MQILAAAIRVLHRASDDGDITGKPLACRAPRQCGQDRMNIVHPLDQLFKTDDRNVRVWQRRYQARIPLVRENHQAAGLSDSDVGPRDADVRSKELGPQLTPGDSDESRNVAVKLFMGLPAEQFRHLTPRQVNCRQHHMRGPLMRQLDDPLSKVGFANLQPGLLKAGVEMDLLGSHRLGLDDETGAFLTGDRENVLPRLFGALRQKDLRSCCFRLLRESLGEFSHVGGRMALTLSDPPSHFGEVDTFIGEGATRSVSLRKASQGAGERRIFQRGINCLLKLAHSLAPLPLQSSTRMMMSFRGP